MRVRIPNLAQRLLLAALALAGVFALVPTAAAQEAFSSVCLASEAESRPSQGVLAANSHDLLPRDGVGFFAPGLDRIALHVAGSGLDEIDQAATDVTRALEGFYDQNDFEIESRSTADAEGPGARLVVIDGDIGVPGSPTVFEIGGVNTLYLHWTTAATDITTLLDIPTFEAITSGDSTQKPARCALAETNDSPSVTTTLGTAGGDGLAYVDDGPTGALVSLDDAVGDLPLADATPREQWPYSVAGAAAIVTAGGVVLHRRGRLFGPVAETEPVVSEKMPTLKLVEPPTDEPVAAPDEPKPRYIYLDDGDGHQDGAHQSPSKPAHRRLIDLDPKREESPLARSVDRHNGPDRTTLLGSDQFAELLNDEWSRFKLGGRDGAVGSVVLAELDSVRLRLGANAAKQLLHDVADMISESGRRLDVVGMASDTELAVLMPELSEAEAHRALDSIANLIASATFRVGQERVLLTPASGFAMLSDTDSTIELVRAVEQARAVSMLNLDLDPERWDGTGVVEPPSHGSTSKETSWRDAVRTPLQILLTVFLSWGVPFLTYVGLNAVGIDVSFIVYVVLVSSLVVTGIFILAEGMLAVDQKEPPEVPTVPYPKASALIAAYLPNEAATVMETIESFLALDYANEVQIILAYNTPETLPVEEHLDRLALEHPNFVPVRIVGSNSKAQNVNAALSMAEGEFIGMFDADHQPRPDAFTRAWKWLDAGYDVVQGHCLTRNGDSGFLAKMIAVEFESIYAVAHPGRAKMHRFGVFGGSNGFWRTELLHETRMRGSMLTEDIDSSMRVVERGYKIRSDRDLVSRELATTTFKQIWNQRMRWAQGWFQVTLEHVKVGMRSKHLNMRQKFGVFHLLMWREIYPWLSQQLFPLLAFWAIQAGGVNKLDWTVPIFLISTMFTFSVGPLQTIYAYRLADDEIKQHKSWFWMYLLFTSPFYTEYKNLISRVAHVKQFMGESNWRVTPRSADPGEEDS